MEYGNLRQVNLGDWPQDLRLRIGAIAFSLGLVFAVVLLKLGAPTPSRLLLAVPFFLGANGLYAGLFRTCSVLAMRGLRDNGDGPTPIVDRNELTRVRRTAMKVTAYAMLSCALATSLFVLL
ncbi:MAG: hypothetical protein ABI134_28280 [Byssovorax sp.]